ncbi:YfjI family protein, partial [Mariniblastus sp.]|nr:YfjI family protein [Mariniblastus sp.]
LHLLGWSSNQLGQDSVEISGECMERAVELCWFFIREVELIDYRAGLANQTTQEPSIEELCGIVERYLVRNNKQGYISHSELRNGLKKRPGLESSDQLERVTLKMKENGTLENADSKSASNQTVTGYRYSPHR